MWSSKVIEIHMDIWFISVGYITTDITIDIYSLSNVHNWTINKHYSPIDPNVYRIINRLNHFRAPPCNLLDGYMGKSMEI